MIIIGLTGSIGMGKSTAANILRQMGIPVHCSDEAVHTLLSSGGAAVDAVADEFPQTYDRKNKSIDRAALGALVFGNDERRVALEAIVHPLVIQSQQKFIADQTRQRAGVVVLDIPLLFETGADNRVDYTVVVTTPDFIQRERVMGRPGMTEEKFNAILAHQMPDAEKRRRADYIVNTGIGLAETRHELQNVLRNIQEGK